LDDRKGIWLTNERVSLLPKGCLLGQVKEGNQAGTWLTQIHLENGHYNEGGGARVLMLQYLLTGYGDQNLAV